MQEMKDDSLVPDQTASTGSRWRVPLSDLPISDELVAAVLDTVRSGWWSMGPRVTEFEVEFARFCGAREAIAVANGTAALHLALLAVGCGPGDEVVVSSLNFVAAANMITHTGAEPVFCDIVGPNDLNLDPADLERAIGPRTRAVVVMHYGGFACDMDAVRAVAERHGLAVVEDAAHAPGASWNGRMCGTLGDIGCFSFFSNKNLPVGEGGMLLTDEASLAEKLRLLRSHGMTTLTWERHKGHAASYDVVAQGFNYRLDEVRAALGLVQLRRLPSENARRAEIASRYRETIGALEGVTMPFGDDGAQRVPSHHLAVVVLPPGIEREGLRAELDQKGIQTSVHYPPIHTFSRYRAMGARRALPRTDEVSDRLLTLPLFGAMSDEQVDAVVDAFSEALTRSLGRS
jgi:dTDP-4-amino-4,6-dideoxygalactose transaminase